MSSFDVSGKVALITGGARGIGLETARALHARGASVAILGIDADAAHAAALQLGDRAIGLAGDVTDLEAMHRVVDQTTERFGRLDVVVANAGIAPKPMTILATPTENFDRIIEVDLLGVYRTVQPALPQVIANRGHVVVISSVYAFVNGVLVAPYAVAKAGVEQYGRALRGELAQHGASASVAYFGFIDTEMSREGFSHPLAQRLEATIPRILRRRLAPAAAAAAIADGIERRAPRIVAPKRWVALSVLRGMFNPLHDRYTERNRTIQGILIDANADTSPEPTTELPVLVGVEGGS